MSSPKMYMYIYVLSSQTTPLLAGISKSVAGLLDMEGNGSWMQAEMYAGGTGSS